MSRAALLAFFAATASACSFVIGTTTRTLDVDSGSGEDATEPEAGGDDAEAGGLDAGPDVPTCSIAGCLAEAGVCGTSCGVTAASCIAACKTQPCKDNCNAQDTACRNACAATCNACTLGAGCEDQASCADAAAM